MSSNTPPRKPEEVKPYSYDFNSVIFVDEYAAANSIILRFKFNCPDTGPHSYEIGLINVNVEDIRIKRNQLRLLYDEFRMQASTYPKPRDKQKMHQLYNRMAKLGESILDYIKSNDINKSTNEQLWKFLFSKDSILRTIDLNSSLFIIPLEFLIELNSYKYHWDGFIASKFKFRKTIVGINNKPYQNKKRPKILFVFDGTLSGANEELGFLSDLDTQKDISLEPYGNVEFTDLPSFIKVLNECDFDILHIACHFYHPENLESYIDFGNFCLSESEIRELKPYLSEKLVFLNGCKSENFNVKRTLNMTRSFMENNTSTLICVDLEVPDDFASLFSKNVYRNLFVEKKNISIEQIVYKATKEIVNDDIDIGGFFYSVYGNTFLN